MTVSYYKATLTTALKTLTINAKKSGKSLPDQDALIEQVEEKLILETIQQQEAERMVYVLTIAA